VRCCKRNVFLSDGVWLGRFFFFGVSSVCVCAWGFFEEFFGLSHRHGFVLRMVPLSSLFIVAREWGSYGLKHVFLVQIHIRSLGLVADAPLTAHGRGAGAQPTPEEEAVYREVRAILEQSTQILLELDDYKGAGDHIRKVGPLPMRS
jgi:hypothetical protein